MSITVIQMSHLRHSTEKYVGLKLSDYVAIINAPTTDKPYNKILYSRIIGERHWRPAIRYLNVEMNRFKELAIAQLKAGESVWFGSDVGQSSNRQTGIMATNAYDFTSVSGYPIPSRQGWKISYSESLMTHAMVLTGVDLDDNEQPLKWKVENSWGRQGW